MANNRYGNWVLAGRVWYNAKTGESMRAISGGALPATDTFTLGGAVDQALTVYSANWTANNGALLVSAGTDDVSSNTTSTETAAHWNADTFADDQYAQGTITAAGASSLIGVAVRCAASANTYYGFYGYNGASYLFSVKAGVWAQLGSDGGAFEVGDVIRLEVSGNTLTPKINGSTTGTPGQQTDSSSPIASGYAGLCGYDLSVNNRIDNWQGGNLSTGATGTLSATLGAATASATGTVAVNGTLSATLAAATLAGSGQVQVTGALAATLADATLSATGTITNITATGTADITLGAATLSAAGQVQASGTASVTLADATLSAAGTVAISGTLAVTLSDATLSATGTVANAGEVSGTLSVTLESATLSAAGAVAIAGAAGITLESATNAASGNVAIAGTGNITLAAATLSATGIVSSYPENFETESSWLIETDTSGAGSTVARSNEQAYNGTYSAKCFTTNSGAKAQVRDVISSPWSGVPSADPGEFIWQRAYIYIPSATANALTGSEYLDFAGFYVSGDSSGWYLRLKASAAIYAVGPGSGGQVEFNLYKAFPLDQWVELEIGLWSQNIEAGMRSFIALVNGNCYGWYRLGVGSTDYDRVAMGVLATNSADDLAVYIDYWYDKTTDADPTGTDNRLTSNPTTIDFRSQSGKDIDFQYQTWEEAGASWQDATRGIGGFRSQAGPNSDKQRTNLESGWAEIVLDWVGGVEPAWPPDETWGTYFFASMVAFKKYFPDEENLEIVILYNYAGSGTAELAYESWVTAGTVFDTWELPEATAEAGAHFPEPGDRIRVRWEETSATNLKVEADYYDASTATWYLTILSDERDMTNQAGVNWLDHKHNSVSITTETTKYSVRSIQYGTLATLADGNLNETLADATLTGAGAVTIAGSLSVTLADATLSGTGIVADVISIGTLTVTLADAILSGTGTLAIAGTGNVTLADATLGGSGAVAIYGQATFTLANATLGGIGTVADQASGPGTRDILYVPTRANWELAARATLYVPAREELNVDN